MKRYVAEPASGQVRDAMRRADGWFACRIGFVECVRAIGLAAGAAPVDAFRREWPAFTIVEVDARLTEHAASLTLARGLRSLDALHLAAALLLADTEPTLATWDRRLHAAAQAEGLEVLPAAIA